MTKTYLLLALIAFKGFSAHGQEFLSVEGFQVEKHQPEQTLVIKQTRLLILSPKHKAFKNEKSEAAISYFVAMDDWTYAVSDLSRWLESRGVKTQYVQKRYVSFLQKSGSFFVMDLQKAEKDVPFQALLYKKGKKPIWIGLYENITHPNRLVNYLK